MNIEPMADEGDEDDDERARRDERYDPKMPRETGRTRARAAIRRNRQQVNKTYHRRKTLGERATRKHENSFSDS